MEAPPNHAFIRSRNGSVLLLDHNCPRARAHSGLVHQISAITLNPSTEVWDLCPGRQFSDDILRRLARWLNGVAGLESDGLRWVRSEADTDIHWRGRSAYLSHHKDSDHDPGAPDDMAATPLTSEWVARFWGIGDLGAVLAAHHTGYLWELRDLVDYLQLDVVFDHLVAHLSLELENARIVVQPQPLTAAGAISPHHSPSPDALLADPTWPA